jgi:rod shape-determining protein MreC
MRRTVKYPFLALAVFLFCWISLPKGISDRVRSFAAAPFTHCSFKSHSDEVSHLELENHCLRAQIEPIYEWLLHDKRISEQLEFLKGAEKKEFCERRVAHLRELLSCQLSSLPAQVSYRDPSSWSSSLWINVGEKSNRALGKKVIAKNSPVLADGALVGVVEYVGESQARVRLITDSGLSPSVRVSRGGLQNRELARQLDSLRKQLEKRDDLFPSAAEKELFLNQLNGLSKSSGMQWEDGYLAKGEVHGSSAPFWRSRGPMLRGIGFNFDYPDDEGSSRDLRGGVPILKEGDLLITSGLDGVFPAGLQVGTVAKIEPLKEGGYSYEIEVRPSASNLNDLQTLFILPPVSE